ncbi:preprotein translocase subunit YajC [Limosilactobacillus sp.]|uniref:preprotein translocase subunit YajC n=1 Tax=Limosilactobacillus sp. TaxID=2773925 RepID=UPI003DA851CA
MIALMYFFMIRPQQKQRKQHQDMMSQLHKGDEVVTIGRMHGKIDSINREDRTVTLDCEGIYLTFDMVAIARVIKSADAEKTEDKASEPAEKKEASSETKEELAASDSSKDEEPASDADSDEK